MRKELICLLLACLLNNASEVLADTDVNVVGLFSGKAVLIINKGKPQTLSSGQTTPQGVKLISADSKKPFWKLMVCVRNCLWARLL